jgi:hypothetical protein
MTCVTKTKSAPPSTKPWIIGLRQVAAAAFLLATARSIRTKALGMTLPESILLRASEVIE